jgi:hypothetical protein
VAFLTGNNSLAAAVERIALATTFLAAAILAQRKTTTVRIGSRGMLLASTTEPALHVVLQHSPTVEQQ